MELRSASGAIEFGSALQLPDISVGVDPLIDPAGEIPHSAFAPGRIRKAAIVLPVDEGRR